MADYSNYGLLFDYKYCSDCHTCEVACKNHLKQTAEEFAAKPGIVVLEKGPYHLEEGNPDAWDWDYIPVPTALCDLCVDRLEEGKKAACVKHCLALCIEIGPLEDLVKRAAELGNKVSIFKP